MTPLDPGWETAKGLTTTKAAFVEEARSRGELFIHQPYERYTEENQETWGGSTRRSSPSGDATPTPSSWRAWICWR